MNKFNTVFRGYNKLEVQKCIDEIIKQYELLLQKSKKTEETNNILREKLSYYQNIENTMNKAIFNAESAGDQIKNAARKEAESLVTEARRNASRIINDALLKAEKAQNQHSENRASIERKSVRQKRGLCRCISSCNGRAC